MCSGVGDSHPASPVASRLSYATLHVQHGRVKSCRANNLSGVAGSNRPFPPSNLDLRLQRRNDILTKPLGFRPLGYRLHLVVVHKVGKNHLQFVSDKEPSRAANRVRDHHPVSCRIDQYSVTYQACLPCPNARCVSPVVTIPSFATLSPSSLSLFSLDRSAYSILTLEYRNAS